VARSEGYELLRSPKAPAAAPPRPA
jgi:hypothetical protein